MRLVVLTLLAGCAQLFGLDETSGSDVAALDITRISIGSTVVPSPQSLAGQTASFLVADATQPSGVRTVAALANGSEWTAPVSGTPPVLFTLPNFAGLLAIDTRHSNFAFGVLEHPNPAPATPSAMFQVQGTLPTPYAAGESLQLYVVGAWIAHPVPPPGVGSTAINTAQFALADTDSLIGPRLQIATADAVVFLRYDMTGTLTAAGEAPGFPETATNTVIFPSGNVPGAITAFPQDVTLSVPLAATPAELMQRHTATQPPPTSAVSMPWAVVAAPGSDFGSTAGPTLKSGAVTMLDTMIATTFGNPFTPAHAWPSTFVWNTFATRTYTGTLPVTLSSQLLQIGPAAASLVLDQPAGMPTSIQIDQTALTSDGLTVTFDPSAMAVVSFVADKMANTLYTLQVRRLVPNAAGTAFTFEDRLDVYTTSPSFSFPANVFKSGEQYTLRVTCVRGGFPGLSSGDLTMRTLPVAIGALDSGVFTAM